MAVFDLAVASTHLAPQFTGLLGTSAIFDVIWMMRNDQNGFIKFLTVVLTLLKACLTLNTA